MLRLTNMTVYRVSRPLITPWKTAYGEETDVETLVCRSVSADGVEAWVESCPLKSPLYLPETAATAFTVLRDHLASVIIGRQFDSPAAAYDHLSHFKGNSFAKAVIDLSFWAQACLAKGMPLHTLLEGNSEPVPIGRGFSLSDGAETLIATIEAAVARGCQRAKLKVSPTTSLADLKNVRDRFPALPMHVDCNGSFSPDDTALLLDIDQLGFHYIEQPFHYKRLAAHADFQQQIETPICLDESIRDVDDAVNALDMGACKAMALKPGRVGGITPFLRILDMCQEHGISCYVGGMLESGLGTAINCELATLPGLDYVPDLPVSGQYFEEDLVSPGIVADHGMVQPSSQPWVGQQVRLDVLMKNVVDQADLT